MSIETHRIPGAPFDLLVVSLCPRDVQKYFHLEAEWQRDVRIRSTMIPGIQQTLRRDHTLPAWLTVFKNPDDDRYVVIDGKHRLVALENLSEQIRCTLYAACFRVRDRHEAVAIFKQLNLNVPPGLKHFASIAATDNHPTMASLKQRLPFTIRFASGQLPANHRERCGIPVTKLVNTLCAAFEDLPRLDRFTLHGALDEITDAHIDLLAQFTNVWEKSQGPLNRTRVRFNPGWYDVLFRIWVQNQNFSATTAQWAEALTSIFQDPKIQDDKKFFHPRSAITNPERLKVILKALQESLGHKVSYDRANLPHAAIVLETQKRAQKELTDVA